ncbi:MAG: hypothetical protein JSW53_06540 [Candidatus Bathyarchaeota archaeon]|nr:MAG: hypothetical protein JSW53_06540 [Candidatus Bathyarchaeota archaeon]
MYLNLFRRGLPIRDKSLGTLLFTVSVLAMVGYFFWLLSWVFLPDATMLGKPLSEWALIIPVGIIVYSFLFIVAWVGWAMVSTPPSLTAVEKTLKEEEKNEEEE